MDSSQRPSPARQMSFGFTDRPVQPPRRILRQGTGPRPGRQSMSPRPTVEDERQAPLPLVRRVDEAARLRLQRRIGSHLRGELRVVVTDNRYSIISVRRGPGSYEVRLHHMFLDAEPAIVRALGRYIARNDVEASALINTYIDEHQNLIRLSLPPEPRQVQLRPQGRCFDLQEIFDDLNLLHFGGRIQAQITWGRRAPGRPRRHRTLKMGSYSVEERLIRIHPALDRSFVPRFFVEYIVFHEMLHQVHEIPVINGRRHYHTPAFVEHERRFPWYDNARRWERENLSRILYY